MDVHMLYRMDDVHSSFRNIHHSIIILMIQEEKEQQRQSTLVVPDPSVLLVGWMESVDVEVPE